MLTSDPAESMLIAAVCNEPADDIPRFSYADWVERNAGNEGAEFADYIRRTIKAYREQQKLSDRAAVEILTGREERWSNGVSKLARLIDYVRGFVAHARTDGATWIKNGDEIARRCPLQYAHK